MKKVLQQRLAEYGQEHLVDFWDQLDEASQQRLNEQIDAVDFALLAQLASHADDHKDLAAMAEKAVPPPAFRLEDRNNEFSPEEAVEAGRAALREGRVGSILVAGGEGTRLGFPHPKGMFPLGPVSQRSLFQIHFDYLKAQSDQAGAAIPLFIMTSPATHAPTVEYLEKHDFFGMTTNDVTVFCQGTIPAVDADSGRILLAAPDELALSPDGHGGMLAALVRAGGLKECARRGIDTLYYFQVDNPLVRVCDPEFLGYHLLSHSEMSTQAVRKQTPLDRVGTIVSMENQTRIIEYSDLPDAVAEQRDADGSLALWAGNVAVHAFDVAFLSRVAGDAAALPFHRAHKIVPCIDREGRGVKSNESNAIKFERFIFDLLPSARHAIVVEVDAATSFAPVKNESGSATETAETSRAALIALHRGWLESAGVTVASDVAVEISPQFAIDAEALRNHANIEPPINKPTFLQP